MSPARLCSRAWLLRFAILFLASALLLVVAPHAYADTGAAPADSTGSIVTTTALWGLIVGVITPPIVAVIQQPTWSTQTRSIVGAGIAVVFAVVTCWVDGSLGHGQTLLATIGAVLVASQTTYRELWSKVGVTQAIEGATSPSPEGSPGDSQADPPLQTKSRRGG
jgi:hypothetical protein